MQKNVLLVDDDPIFNFLARNIINNIGFANDIDIALNGKEALDLLHTYELENKELPRYIFLDLNMPIMNGFEFLEKFQELDIKDKTNIEITIVTSSTDEEDIRRSKEFGINYFLTKPISKDDIMNVISED